MSVFDGLADAINSVPAGELRFTANDIFVIINALDYYKKYLEVEDDNSCSPVLSFYDKDDMDVVQDLLKMFLNYKFK